MDEKDRGRGPELFETPVINGMQAGAQGPAAGGLGEGTRRRVITSLSWRVADAKHRFDDCHNNLENGSEGGYSDELTEAIELLDALKKGIEIPDQDRLKAAFREGFDHAKKIILAEIDLLGK